MLTTTRLWVVWGCQAVNGGDFYFMFNALGVENTT